MHTCISHKALMCLERQTDVTGKPAAIYHRLSGVYTSEYTPTILVAYKTLE